MKKFAILFAGLFLMTFAFQSVNAQNQNTASSSASAEIMTTLKIVKDTDLDFKQLAPSNNAGTVTMTNAGVRNGDANATPVGGGNGVAAKFTIEGVDGEAIKVTMEPANGIFDVTKTNGTETMEVTLDPDDVAIMDGITALPAGGTQELTFGASIAVGANQAAGTYNNATAFTLTVIYQ